MPEALAVGVTTDCVKKGAPMSADGIQEIGMEAEHAPTAAKVKVNRGVFRQIWRRKLPPMIPKIPKKRSDRNPALFISPLSRNKGEPLPLSIRHNLPPKYIYKSFYYPDECKGADVKGAVIEECRERVRVQDAHCIEFD